MRRVSFGELLERPYLLMDETTVQVLEEPGKSALEVRVITALGPSSGGGPSCRSRIVVLRQVGEPEIYADVLGIESDVSLLSQTNLCWESGLFGIGRPTADRRFTDSSDPGSVSNCEEAVGRHGSASARPPSLLTVICP